MEQIKTVVESWFNQLPRNLQPYGWIILGTLFVILLFSVLMFGRYVRSVFRRSRALNLSFGPTECLAEYPLPAELPCDRCLTVEGVPVRIRLAILAPMGTQLSLDLVSAEDWLDRVLWGLGDIARHDRPRILLWPPQLSRQGFVAAFARTVRRPEPEGEASCWILLAGQTPHRPQPILLGLALKADVPVHIGRMTLAPGQWASAMRIQSIQT